MKTYFTKVDMRMSNKHIKRYSISLAIRKMRVKNHNDIPLHTY